MILLMKNIHFFSLNIILWARMRLHAEPMGFYNNTDKSAWYRRKLTVILDRIWTFTVFRDLCLETLLVLALIKRLMFGHCKISVMTIPQRSLCLLTLLLTSGLKWPSNQNWQISEMMSFINSSQTVWPYLWKGRVSYLIKVTRTVKVNSHVRQSNNELIYTKTTYVLCFIQTWDIVLYLVLRKMRKSEKNHFCTIFEF